MLHLGEVHVIKNTCKTILTAAGTSLLLQSVAWSASFSVNDATVKESDGRATVSIVLSEPSTQASQVSLATSKDTAINGSDFYGTHEVVNFAAGETRKNVNLTILNDTEVEAEEQFKLRLFAPSAGNTLNKYSALVKIIDDDGDVPDPIDPNNDVSLPGLPVVSDAVWDDGAVRRVLHNFAYGGYASDAQIRSWANMKPWTAIKQILTFYEHNLRLAPHSPQDRDDLSQVRGTLQSLGQLWGSNSANNRTPPEIRDRYGVEGWNLPYVWMKAAMVRGLNPVRQKIGLWETNTHMAVNRDAGLFGAQIVSYYDSIMTALNNGEPYHSVIAKAAASSAVAEQYKHKDNQWIDGVCECNEDFGREFHQLFFGILGQADPNKHETVTIKNTAKVLTDMQLPWREDIQSFDPVVQFGSQYHHKAALTILDTQIGASQTALPKINQLAARAINHPESRANLPVKIVSDLIDDNLSAAKKTAIRQAWGSMAQPNLLSFLQAYAISTLYHDASRVKYWTSIDRHTLQSTRMALGNEAIHLEIYDPLWNAILAETTSMFSPIHNVFGAQTSMEAARSAHTFQNNYNFMTDYYWRFYNPVGNGFDRPWRKDWSQKMPASADGSYRVKDVAPWLWNYIVGDDLKNFGPLERAYVYAEIAGSESLQWLLDRNNPNRVIRSSEISGDPQIRALVTELGNRTLNLKAANLEERERVNGEIGTAVNFIAATPYMFAQEGR